jgi:hypothetical protein
MLADPAFVRQVGEAATEIIGRSSHGLWRMDMTGWTPEGGIDDRVWMPPWPLPNVWVGTSIENDESTGGGLMSCAGHRPHADSAVLQTDRRAHA